jgi:hypothetical protein
MVAARGRGGAGVAADRGRMFPGCAVTGLFQGGLFSFGWSWLNKFGEAETMHCAEPSGPGR